MSREDVIAVAVRLFAIHLLFGILHQIPAAADMMLVDDDLRWGLLFGVTLVAGFALCAFLWVFPLTIARRLLPAMREPRSERSIDAGLAMTLGITLMGFWFLANALLDAIYWLVFVVQAKRQGLESFHLTPDRWAGYATTVAQFVLALVLLLGASGIRNLIERLRHGNRDRRDPMPGDE